MLEALNNSLAWSIANFGAYGLFGFILLVTYITPLTLALIFAKIGKATGKWR